MYKIKLHKKVEKFLNKKSPNEVKRVIKAFEKLQKNPYPIFNSSVKKLVDTDKFRLRVGKYRFIYLVFEEELLIFIEDGDSRGDIYK